jgi:N-acetylneuraminate synthase
VNKDLPKGYVINIQDLESKKPGDRGIPAKSYKLILGKQITKDKKQWDFLTREDFN